MKFMHDYLLAVADRILMAKILGNPFRDPDLVIAPDGVPYIYRWHVIPQNPQCGTYFHIQVSDDPERPLHDHPWDNMSVILSGGYDELWDPRPWQECSKFCLPETRQLRQGDVVFRKAEEAHRLLLPKEFSHTMTLFSTGPKRREWGFWYKDGWRPYTDVTRTQDGMSVHVKPEGL